MNPSPSHRAILFALFAAALLSTLVALPAAAAYPPCSSICQNNGPSTNCSCEHEQFPVVIHTTCGQVHTACSCSPMFSSSAFETSPITLFEPGIPAEFLTPAVQPQVHEEVAEPQEVEPEKSAE